MMRGMPSHPSRPSRPRPDSTRGSARLAPAERRAQLLGIASAILAESGPDGLRIPDVADAAGVSRAAVYKHFDGREAVIVAVLEDFRDDLEERFRQSFRALPEDLETVAQISLACVCETIEAKGAGAWTLLGSGGHSPEVGAVVAPLQKRLVATWLKRVQTVTGLRRRDAEVVAEMLSGANRAALAAWVDGRLSRDAAIAHAVTATTAMLSGFTRS